MMKVVKNESSEGVKYDPSKKYIWGKEDKFVLTGEQFGRMLNALRATLSTPEAQRFRMIEIANDDIEEIMALSVEKGIIKENPNVE